MLEWPFWLFVFWWFSVVLVFCVFPQSTSAIIASSKMDGKVIRRTIPFWFLDLCSLQSPKVCVAKQMNPKLFTAGINKGQNCLRCLICILIKTRVGILKSGCGKWYTCVPITLKWRFKSVVLVWLVLKHFKKVSMKQAASCWVYQR